MFLTKKRNFLSVLLIMLGIMSCVVGCGSSDKAAEDAAADIDELLMLSILDGESSGTSMITEYDTQAVEEGSLSDLFYATGQFSFKDPIPVNQPYEHGDIVFVKYNVSFIGNDTYVEEGTSLATLRFSVDPVAKEEARIALGKAQTTYNKGLADRDRELEQLNANINSAETFYERQLLVEEYSKALMEYDEYVINQETIIAGLQEEYDVFLNETVEYEIFAPVSGRVARDDTFRAGDLIDNDAALFYIYPLDKLYITARTKDFNYGETVTVIYTPGTEQFTFEGVVISSDNILYNTDASSCQIEVDMADLPDLSALTIRQLTSRMNVSVNRAITDRGILVPVLAFDSIRDNLGVLTTYSDNTTYKSNVKVAYKAKNYAWVIGGLDEGDLIVN